MCINRLLILFRFFLFLQLLKPGFCCPHIFKKSSFKLHKQYGFLYLLQLPASVTIIQDNWRTRRPLALRFQQEPTLHVISGIGLKFHVVQLQKFSIERTERWKCFWKWTLIDLSWSYFEEQAHWILLRLLRLWIY